MVSALAITRKGLIQSLYAATCTLALTPPAAAAELETYLEFEKAMLPRNLAIGPVGQMFMSDGSNEVLFRSDDELPWPDGFANGVDGYVYTTINELHRSPVLNNDAVASKGIYKILRLKSPSDTISGR